MNYSLFCNTSKEFCQCVTMDGGTNYYIGYEEKSQKRTGIKEASWKLLHNLSFKCENGKYTYKFDFTRRKLVDIHCKVPKRIWCDTLKKGNYPIGTVEELFDTSAKFILWASNMNVDFPLWYRISDDPWNNRDYIEFFNKLVQYFSHKYEIFLDNPQLVSYLKTLNIILRFAAAQGEYQEELLSFLKSVPEEDFLLIREHVNRKMKNDLVHLQERILFISSNNELLPYLNKILSTIRIEIYGVDPWLKYSYNESMLSLDENYRGYDEKEILDPVSYEVITDENRILFTCCRNVFSYDTYVLLKARGDKCPLCRREILTQYVYLKYRGNISLVGYNEKWTVREFKKHLQIPINNYNLYKERNKYRLHDNGQLSQFQLGNCRIIAM